MLELLNSILMLDHQAKSSFITETEKKALLKSKLRKLQILSGEIQKETIETYQKIRVFKNQTQTH